MNNWIYRFARKMMKIGVLKEQARNRWLKKSTLKERIKITEELLYFSENLPNKTLPISSFRSLSLWLSNSKK